MFSEMVLVILKVQWDEAGAVIGGKGHKIKEIRTLSHAHIDIDPRSGNHDRLIRIQGREDHVELAKHLINMHISRHNSSLTDIPEAPMDVRNNPDIKAAAASLAMFGHI